MTLNELTAMCYLIAKEHGWHDEGTSFPHDCGMIMSELGEAIQSDRHGEPGVWYRCNHKYHNCGMKSDQPCIPDECIEYKDGFCDAGYAERKMEGRTAEMVDVLIRLLDWFGANGVTDLETLVSDKCEENRLRPYRHGRKY